MFTDRDGIGIVEWQTSRLFGNLSSMSSSITRVGRSEFKVFHEFVANGGWHFEFVGANLYYQQVAVSVFGDLVNGFGLSSSMCRFGHCGGGYS